ncbi:MAG: hypothetical protein M1814_005775 [Vezdaea aestivalis]|nr:MAG: hypothetical protein M1814_005775 [Vezdaea aestivalis]
MAVGRSTTLAERLRACYVRDENSCPVSRLTRKILPTVPLTSCRCAVDGHPEHNMHLRCEHDPRPRLQITPYDPVWVPYIDDLVLLVYCLTACKCKSEDTGNNLAQFMHRSKWFGIAPGWIANTLSSGIQIATSANGNGASSISVTTLLHPLPDQLLRNVPEEVIGHPIGSDFMSGESSTQEDSDAEAAALAEGLDAIRVYTPGYLNPNTPEKTQERPRLRLRPTSPQTTQQATETRPPWRIGRPAPWPLLGDRAVPRPQANPARDPPRHAQWLAVSPRHRIGRQLEGRSAPVQDPVPNSEQPPEAGQCAVEDYEFHDPALATGASSSGSVYHSANEGSGSCAFDLNQPLTPSSQQQQQQEQQQEDQETPADPVPDEDVAGPSDPNRRPYDLHDWLVGDWALSQLRIQQEMQRLEVNQGPDQPELYDATGQLFNSSIPPHMESGSWIDYTLDSEDLRTPGGTEPDEDAIWAASLEYESNESLSPYPEDELEYEPMLDRPDFGVIVHQQTAVGIWRVQDGQTIIGYTDPTSIVEMLAATRTRRRTSTSSTETLTQLPTTTSSSSGPARGPLGPQTLKTGLNRQGYVTDRDYRWGAWHVRDGVTSYRPWKYPSKKPSRRRDAGVDLANLPNPRLGARNAAQTAAWYAERNAEKVALERELDRCNARLRFDPKAADECAWWAPYEVGDMRPDDDALQVVMALGKQASPGARATAPASPRRTGAAVAPGRCGNSCSSFDSKSCGETCKCIAKPDVRSNGGEWLFVGVCAGIYALGGGRGSKGGFGGARGGLTLGLGGRGLDKRFECQAEGWGCPCNVSYVSARCCEAGHGGMVWEDVGLKLGRLSV